MDAAEIAQDIQQRESWTDATLLDLVLQYVQNQDANGAFRDHLEEHSAGGGEPQSREVHLRLAVPEGTSDAAPALNDRLAEGATTANDRRSSAVGQVMLSDPASLAAAIARIVDYNWATEQRDYDGAGRGGNSKQGHIFCDLRAVRAWLDSASPAGQLSATLAASAADGPARSPNGDRAEGRIAPAGGKQPSGGGAGFTPGPWPTSGDVPPAERA